jgi:ABC-2 type transport system permease protein
VDLGGDFLTLPPTDDVRRFDTEADAIAAVRAGEITTYVLIEPDFLQKGHVVVKSTLKRTIFDLESGIEGVPDNVRAYIRNQVLSEIDERRRARIELLFVEAPTKLIDREGAISTEKEFDIERLIVALAFFIAMFISANMGGAYLLQGLGDEKENRVMEMVLTSVRAEELMWGKLLGLGGAGFLQLIIWGTMSVTGLLTFAIPLVLEPVTVLVCLPLFLLGYLLIGSLMLGTGSLGSNLREVNQWSAVWATLSVIPMFMLQPVLAEPHGALARGLTFFPLTTASMLILRYALDPDGLPLWELAAAYAVLIVSCWLAVKGASKIYKVGLLLYGKRPTPRQLWRWLFR